jgi:cystathionine gamma-synthase
MALPRWRDVIAYEEHEPACRSALQTIYPRFGLHPFLQELANQVPSDGMRVWPFASRAAAEAAQKHCQRKSPQSSLRLLAQHKISCLFTDAAADAHAKAFWQHTGLGASSRQAAIALGHELAPAPNQGEQARQRVRQRLAAIHHCPEEHISLVPAGMAALHAGLEAVQTLRPGRPTLQLGFPYVDVLKQPQVVFHGSELLRSTDLGDIVATLDRLDPAAVIVELPSNPLLRCVDLPAVAELAHARGIPLIADDTIGTGINLEALPYADLVFTSLTKSFAGRGNVMAGCLLISPDSQWRATLMEAVAPRATLSDADAIALEQSSRDVNERVPRLDANCLALAQKLETHPAVKRVLHPKDCKNFQALKKRGAGDGCLLSFELHAGERNAQRVFDALQICKGPSLGTSFSLVCPYTQLAHYDELDWAEACGVPAHLLRVSVGLEEPDELWSRFQKALAHATDRPKV